MENFARRPPPAVLEGLLITFFVHRRRLLWVPALILAASLVAAVLVPVRYAIDAQVLVGLGPEYNYRPAAGEQASVSQALDRDQTMHTESMIIGNPDLHRDTLRAIGVARLYPRYLHVGLLTRAVAGLRSTVAAAVAWVEGTARPPAPPPDPVDLALDEFDSALKLDVPKTGSIITATFRHIDAALGAETLNRMLALYIERRSALYRDDQSGIVARQVEVTKAALDAAESQLAAFRLSHQVGGFEARRDILLRRRGELASDRADAQSQTAQLRVRLDGVTAQLARVPQDVTSGRDTDYEVRVSPARASLEQLRAQYAHALVEYREDAPLVASLRAQIAAREADLSATRNDRSATSVRTAQNPAWLSLQDDRLKSETNLSVQQTRLLQDDAHLAELSTEIAALDRSEEELGRLQLQRAVSEETYRNATKTLEDRRVADVVEANRRPTVRILQSAVAPPYPPPIRRLIVGAGVVLAAFGLCAATLLTHAFARTYWQPEALEQDFGIAVIAVIHELPPAATG